MVIIKQLNTEIYLIDYSSEMLLSLVLAVLIGPPLSMRFLGS